MHPEARRLIDTIGMTPHPEGGYYRETFRSAATVTTQDGRARSAATAIYFLLTSELFSAFHRIASDETWHFYCGDPIAIEIIADGAHHTVALGAGDAFQTTVPAGATFASHVDAEDGFALVGCDVAPGFEFGDLELPTRADLCAAFPSLRALIERFTRA